LAPVVVAGTVAGLGAITAFASVALPIIAVGLVGRVLLLNDD
jgi:hypothetical protein